MVSEEIIFKVFSFSMFCIMVSMTTITNAQWAKNIWLTLDISGIITITNLSKYLQLLGSECRFFIFFPL